MKTRRLLVAHGLDRLRSASSRSSGRAVPSASTSRFVRQATILETNGRRWHDDPPDYECDNDKWSVPGRHGFRIVLATWPKVTEHPADLLAELRATLCRLSAV